MKKQSLLLFLVGLFANLYSGTVVGVDQRSVDSLNTVLETAVQDTTRVNAMIALCDHYYLQDPDTTIALCLKAQELSELHQFDYGLSESYGWLGYLYMQKGLTPLALEYFIKSWKVREKIGDKEGVANALNNIGYIYDSQKDYEQALEHYRSALEIRRGLGNKLGIASILNNIGYIYDIQGNLEKGLEAYTLSLKIRREINDVRGEIESLHNIGTIHRLNNEHDKALEYYEQCLLLNEQVNDLSGRANSFTAMASVFRATGKSQLAVQYTLKAMEIANKLGYPELIGSCADLLFYLYKDAEKFEEALRYYELYITMTDSINNEKNQKATIRQQTQYEFEKAQLIQEQKEKEESRIQAEVLSRRDNLQYSVILIALLILFGGVLFLGFINVSQRMAEGIIFFSFLILFEFLLVLADPYIDAWSGGAPGIKLLFNAGIAALIFPLHSLFERKLKGRLIN